MKKILRIFLVVGLSLSIIEPVKANIYQVFEGIKLGATIINDSVEKIKDTVSGKKKRQSQKKRN